MSEAADVYVLDTSAWLTLIEDESGADVVQELLEKARAGEIVIVVSFIADYRRCAKCGMKCTRDRTRPPVRYWSSRPWRIPILWWKSKPSPWWIKGRGSSRINVLNLNVAK